MVLRDRRILSEKRMIIKGKWLRAFRNQHLGPHRDLVLSAYFERIVLQSKRFLEVRELLIAKTGCLAKRPGRHGPTYRVVLVRESALESHHQMAASQNVLCQPG